LLAWVKWLSCAILVYLLMRSALSAALEFKIGPDYGTNAACPEETTQIGCLNR
jgi:hypothetical protein